MSDTIRELADTLRQALDEGRYGDPTVTLADTALIELERRAEQAESDRDGWKESSDEWQALWKTMKARAEQAEAERDARDTVIELQDQMLAHYRMGNTGERVGRTIDALTEARASLAATPSGEKDD